jgi:SAM-dependent methyltransferase
MLVPANEVRTMDRTANADQVAFWNAEPGQNWVTHQADLDAVQREITERLIEACAPQPGEAALDVGCGAGASTFALAAAVGPSGRALGLDISAPLIARAEERRRELGVANADFALGDAQEHRFEPGRFDLAASRFGMMFFADPVAAFRNIARGLRPGGRLVFVAWAGPEHNPWFAQPARIAIDRLGPVAPSPPDAPGPMAFRDAERVLGLMRAAELAQCRARALEVELHHPGGLDAALRLLAGVGMIPSILREKGGTAEDRAAILDRLRVELDEFRSEDGIRVPARVILYSAAVPA